MSITHVVAAGDLCLPSIGLLADDLSHAFAASDAVRLDLSAVAAPDLSVVQLVESARRRRSASIRRRTWPCCRTRRGRPAIPRASC